eukprot:116453-Pyramimonas_sp.AAC.1
MSAREEGKPLDVHIMGKWKFVVFRNQMPCLFRQLAPVKMAHPSVVDIRFRYFKRSSGCFIHG